MSKENKTRGQERKWVVWKDCVFFLAKIDSKTDSVREKQTEDMQEEAGPYAAVIWHLRPLVTFFLPAFHSRNDAAHMFGVTELYTHSNHTHIHAFKAMPVLQGKAESHTCLVCLQQIVAMPHCLPLCRPRR